MRTPRGAARARAARTTAVSVLLLLLLLRVILLGSGPLGGLPAIGGWLFLSAWNSSSTLQPVLWQDADDSAPVQVPVGEGEEDLPSVDPYASAAPGRVAFLFLTRGPLPLAQLWARFFRGHGHRISIHIHASDPSWHYAPGTLPPVFRGRQIPSGPVRWGDISMVDAERRLLHAALRDPQNLFFVLLSESCIPLWPFPYVFNYLSTSPVSFVEVFECPLGIGYGRYREHMAPEVTKEDFKKGSQWFALHRRHAEMVASDALVYPKFKKFCLKGDEHRNCYSDEHYIPTLLSMRDSAGLANYSVTFADWSARLWHPTLFTPRNVTSREIRKLKNEKRFIRWRSYWFRVRQLRGTLVIDNKTDRPLKVPDGGVCKIGQKPMRCFLFARKFHENTLRFLLRNSVKELGF